MKLVLVWVVGIGVPTLSAVISQRLTAEDPG